MRTDIIPQEELKVGTAAKDAKGASRSEPHCQAEMAEYRAAFKKCMANPGHVYYPVTPEWVPTGNSYLQDHLVGEALVKLNHKHNTRRLGLRFMNEALTNKITQDLVARKAQDLENLIKAYRDHTEELIWLRFATIKLFCPDLPLVGTTDSAKSAAELASRGKRLAAEPRLVNLIEGLVMIAIEECEPIANELGLQLRNPTSPEGKAASKRYAEFWSEYFCAALELDSSLADLNEAINKATAELLPKTDPKLPRFSVWRLFVGIFRAKVFLPLRTNLKSALIDQAKNLALHSLEIMKRPVAPVSTSTSAKPADLLAYMKTPLPKVPSGPVSLKPGNEIAKERREISSLWQSLFDFDLSEATVVLLDTTTLKSSMAQDVAFLLSQMTQEVCDTSEVELIDPAKRLAWLEEHRRLLKQVFPRCMWNDFDYVCGNCVLKIYESSVRSCAEKYCALKRDNPTGLTALIAPTAQVSQKLKLQLPKIKSREGKAIIGSDNHANFLRYLASTEAELARQYENQLITLEAAKHRGRSVEDDEIEIKNARLDLTIKPEDWDCFALSGVDDPVRRIHV